MRPRRGGWVPLVALLWAAGCYASGAPGDAETGAADGGTALDGAAGDDAGFEDVCAPDEPRGLLNCMILAACRQLAVCESYDSPFNAVGLYARFRLACHPTIGAASDDLVRHLTDGIEAGLIAFDAAAARECFAWREERCPRVPADLFAGPDACRRMLQGTLPPGSPCRFWRECAGAEWRDAYCAFPEGACSDLGTCTAVPTEGEPCDRAIGCQLPLVCNSRDVCAMPAAEGEPCEDYRDCEWGVADCVPDPEGNASCHALWTVEGEECSYSCSNGLMCGAGRCVTPARFGESCGDERPCDDGLRCQAGTCAHIVTLGEPCDDATAVCAIGLSCVHGACAPLPIVGQSCDAVGRCAEGQCAAGVCVLAPIGTPCDWTSPFDECEGFCAHRSVDACRPLVLEGNPCTSTTQCEDDLECVGGVCTECEEP